MEINDLQKFAYEQAKFVYSVSQTMEREEILRDTPYIQTVNEARKSELGKKYLVGVTFDEIKRELRHPGSFMDANTELGFYLPDDCPEYVEDWVWGINCQ